MRGDFPGPEPRWTGTGGTLGHRCGGGPCLEVWARGATTGGNALILVETGLCAPGRERDVGGDGNDTRAVLVYETGVRGTPGSQIRHEAVSGTLFVHRCDESAEAPFADVSFAVELEGGGTVEGRIATPLELESGFE